MELQQLRYFVAAADLENFTKAADRCLVAQPSLSQQIIKLEKEFGQPLFDRLGRTVRLTDAGRALYDRARSILSAVEEAKCLVADSADDLSGVVSIGAIPTVAPYLLPSVVKEFHRRYPRAQVAIEENLTEYTIENCLRGEVDVGIMALPVVEPQLHAEPLFEEELLLALPSNHPLAKKETVSVHDLDGQMFVLLNEVHCLGKQIVSFCDRESCSPHMACRSAQLLTVQELVAVGQGVSLVPAMACELDRDPRRTYRHLAGTPPTRTIAAVWPRQRYQRPLVKRFVELLGEKKP